MKIISLTEHNVQEVATEAAKVLQEDGIILYPTDTLYGVGANAFSDKAVDTVYALKGREPGKPMHAIVKEVEQVKAYAEFDTQAKTLAAAFWPGPLTLILKKNPNVTTGIGREIDTLGVRIPKNDFCTALTEAFGGCITTTSANRSGMTPVFSIEEILAQFEGNAKFIDLVIDAGTLPTSKPSTIVDLSEPTPLILREGALSAEDIQKALA